MYFTTNLQYFSIYPLPSNKTALRNSQHCTKLQKEIHNLFHNKFYRKTGVLLLLNRQKLSLHSQSSNHAIN